MGGSIHYVTSTKHSSLVHEQYHRHVRTHTPRNSKFKATQVWLLHKYRWNHRVRGLQLQNGGTISLFSGQLAPTLVSPLKPAMLSSCVCETRLQRTDQMFTHNSVCMRELSPLSFLLFIIFIHFPFFSAPLFLPL